MAMTDEQFRSYLPTNITTDFNIGALMRLLNPISGLSGFSSKGKQYVPQSWIKLFWSNNPTYLENKGAGKTAHILAKISAGAVAFGGAAYLLRAFMHSLNIDNIQSIKAGNRASQKLQTINIRPIAPVLDQEQPPEPVVQPQPNFLQKIKAKVENNILKKQSSYPMALGALPPLVALLSMITAFKLADKKFDTQFGNRLDTQIDEATKKGKQIARNRVFQNRDIIPPVPSQNIQKKAAFQGIQAAIGLVIAAVAVAGGFAGFNWHRSNSPSVAKYKAYKKGLETYNKTRNLQENIENSPLSDQFVAQLDANINKKNKPTVQQQTVSEVFV